VNRQNPYTQRQIERAIKAAISAGLTVTGVKPDGTVLTEANENRPAETGTGLTTQQKPRDAREKLGVH
jgi:hypothetical protein